MDKSISERLERVSTLHNVKSRLKKRLGIWKHQTTGQNIMNKASQWAEGVAQEKSLMRTPQWLDRRPKGELPTFPF